jgi:hypothetical protein
MASKKITCECGLQILLQWQRARSSALYSVTCPECSNVHEFMATPPIGVRLSHQSWASRSLSTLALTLMVAEQPPCIQYQDLATPCARPANLRSRRSVRRLFSGVALNLRCFRLRLRSYPQKT